ncbi:MAG: TrmH family RNA methyltransferase [Acidimicrobiia bacterium]
MANPHAATPQEMFDLVAGKRTDDPDWFDFDGVTVSAQQVIEILRDRVSLDRWDLFGSALAERTDNVAVVVEGMVDLGNVGAVIRSADGFGVQAIHAIDTADEYKRSKRTSQGADKWVDRTRWEGVTECAQSLRASGFSLVAMSPSSSASSISEVDLTGRIAVAFGNELEGLSDELIDMADEAVTIPMSGFAGSFNISVAAAVALYEVRSQRIDRFGSNGDFTDARRDQVLAVWLMKSVRESRLIVERYVQESRSGDTR